MLWFLYVYRGLLDYGCRSEPASRFEAVKPIINVEKMMQTSFRYQPTRTHLSRPVLREFQRYLMPEQRQQIIVALSSDNLLSLRGKLPSNIFNHLAVLVAAYTRQDLVAVFLTQAYCQ